jgi:hypothetical protein
VFRNPLEEGLETRYEFPIRVMEFLTHVPNLDSQSTNSYHKTQNSL